MGKNPEKLSKSVFVVNELGLHARAAAKIAELAQKATSSIWIVKGGESADASGILDILTLECVKGSEITIMAENHQDIGIMENIAALIQSGCKE